MRRITHLALLPVAALLFFACNGDDQTTDPEPDVGYNDVEDNTDTDTETDTDAETDVGPTGPSDHRTADCDPLMESYCSMPWPSNLYLESDESRATGYTLDFGLESLPRSRSDQQHVSPTPYRSLDGYGLGTPVVVHYPGVDTSQMPDEFSIEDSVEDDDRQAFYYEVTDDGLKPVPFWAELDVHAESPEEQVLYLRPAVILEENARYIVGFRNLVDDNGDAFDRSEAFEKYLSGEAGEDDELAWRQERFNEIFDLLDDTGIDRDELTIAWDFHTGSSDGLHSEMLHVIEEGVAAADEEGIEITLNQVEAFSDDPADEDNYNEFVAYDIEGTFRVPHFLVPSDRSGVLSYLFHRDDEGNPAISEWREADFWMQIPHSATDGEPHGLVTYGHGMLGKGHQVRGSFNQEIANEYNLIFFGADFIGFSTEDVNQAMQALAQPTYFEELVDRMHQGVLEYVLLNQAMREGLEALPDDDSFSGHDFELVVDHDRLYYSGISQGGIYGVTVLAVDPAVSHGHFGVPGHNYAMLMERSSNYFGDGNEPGYYAMLRLGFNERVDQSMAIPVIQLLWDKIDPISYLRRLSHDPFDADMPNYGLFGLAKGDYQVAVNTKEITARTGIGIPIMENYDREIGAPWLGDEQPASYEGHSGSGIVLYDFGNPWPDAGNAPPDDALGDPHGLPRKTAVHNQQMVHFLDHGEIIDVCDGEPCYFPDAW